MMTERPMLYSAPMVRGLLNDTKTQTRRVVNPQPAKGWAFESPPVLGRITSPHPKKGRFGAFIRHGVGTDFPQTDLIPCPYGQPGDRLWVRETFQYRGASYNGDGLEDADWFRCYGQGGAPDIWDPHFPDGWSPSRHMKAKKLTEPDEQEGDGTTGWVTRRIPGIHMPRWASRITLEITRVRVERLQDISEADAIAEGIERSYDQWRDYRTDAAVNYPSAATPIDSYRTLWEQINGPDSWDANPWVWVVEFKRLDQQAISGGNTK